MEWLSKKRKRAVRGKFTAYSGLFALITAGLLLKIFPFTEKLGSSSKEMADQDLPNNGHKTSANDSANTSNNQQNNLSNNQHTAQNQNTQQDDASEFDDTVHGLEVDDALFGMVSEDTIGPQVNLESTPNTNFLDDDVINIDQDDFTNFVVIGGDGGGSTPVVVIPPLVPTTPTAPPATVSNVNLGTLDGNNGVSFTNLSGGGTVTVSSAGDANGDGLSDVLLGDPTADVTVGFNTFTNAGESYFVDGSSSLSSNVDVQASGAVTVNKFSGGADSEGVGSALAEIGDVNNDGKSDFIVAAPGADESYTFFGSNGGYPSNSAGINAANGYSFAQSEGAFSVGGGGDVNGDGLNDAIVGAPEKDFLLNADAGAATVLFGGNNPPATITFSSSIAGDNVGYSVDIIGDVNGDGYDDVAVSAPGANEVYVIYGADNISVTGPSDIVNGVNGFTVTNVMGGNVVVSAAGDMNKDGYADFAIGQPGAGVGSTGEVDIIFGSNTLGNFSLTTPVGVTTAGFSGNASDLVGQDVSTAGDVNTDGFDDLIISAAGNDKSYVIFGGDAPGNFAQSPIGLNGTNGFFTSAANSGDFVSNAGDVNGDGFDDMLIGSTDGNAYLVYGRQTDSMILGDANANNLIGQEGAADLINGAAGNDTINGQGGGDIIHAASGDDTVTFYSNDLTDGLLDGGSGNDTLLFDDTSQTLDFSAFSTGATGAIPIKNFEELDLSQADHTVTLDRLDLTSLSDTSNTLTVEGEAGDTVNLEHVGADATDVWTNNGLVDATHISYTNDNATLLVDQDVVVNIVPT